MRIPPHEELEVPDEPAGPWWWACARPEVPGDRWTLYAQDDCRACRIALQAHARAQPDVVMELRDPLTAEVLEERLAADFAGRLGGPPP